MAVGSYTVAPNPSFKGEAQRRGTLAIKRRGLRPHFALAVQRATPSGSPLTQTLGATNTLPVRLHHHPQFASHINTPEPPYGIKIGSSTG
jgi:hypothetical protein